LLNIRLPPITADGGRAVVPAPRNPLTEPYVDGRLIRLPRFDRAALRQAATGAAERISVSWKVAGQRFVLRESGPNQVDVLVETDRKVPAEQVLPIRVSGPAGDRDFFMVFVGDRSGRSVGWLRLDVHSWIDVAADGERDVATLDAGDPAVRALVADSVRATPDPGMSAWAAIVESRPAGDRLRRAIEDAAW
jgi:hypothetical protein